MKKLFFYAAAAIAMVASCQKAEVGNAPATPLDDTTPVAMQFGVNAPSFTVTKTKAAVDGWDAVNGTKVTVIGLVQNMNNVLGEGRYDFTNGVIFDQEAYVKNETDKIELTHVVDGVTVPYFYAETKTYDFYAYHLGGATADEATTGVDTKVLPVTITGSNDLMVATPNKTEDIKADTSNDGVTENDVYSAWAARRSVHPTLVFEHALTRFNFIVRGMNANSQNVIVDNIAIKGLANTGKLTVVGAALGFEADAAADPEALMQLKNADDTEFTPAAVVQANTVPAGNGSCLMVQPNLASIDVVIGMHHLYTNGENTVVLPLDAYTFTVNANQVIKDGALANIETFAAGTAYNIYVNVYGPEEIIIKAELTEWKDGGEYTYDPDSQRPGGSVAEPEQPEVTEVTTTAVATNQESFEQIVNGKLTWDDATAATLPWFVINFAQPLTTAEIVVTYSEDPEFVWNATWTKADGFTLLTLSQEEVGRQFTAGTWTVTVNGVATQFVVAE